MGSADAEETIPEPSGQGEERIMVSVRMRPLNEKEASRNEVLDWECINNTTIVYKNHLSPERSLYPTSYAFDRVFGCDCSTRQVYEEGAKTVVLSAVSGINSSVFAYGQTSSGKTYTMSGITEYTVEDIFNYIQKHKEREYQLKFSAMEIYNESVRDLLIADNSPLRLLDDPERGTVVEKLTEETLRDQDHFKELLALCQAQRQIGETFLNEASSRSHQILRLTIESSTLKLLAANNSSTLTATLNFVDLAGSERASQALSAGSRLKEGSHINRSLLTLGTVIRKLSKGGTGHIPYRDSKLTRILQSSLGGNARTAIICTMSPARSYVEQSRNTLLFASRAKEITTNAHVNVVVSDKAMIKHLQRELARMQDELRNASPSVRADTTDLLREKDLKIEELEGRVKELTLQLDHALYLICDLQQQDGKDSCYPKLQHQQALESSSPDTTSVADQQSFDANSLTFEAPQSPERHSSHSSKGSYSISDFEENLSLRSPFEQMFIETNSDTSSPILIQTLTIVGHESHDHQVPERLDEHSANLSEVDPCAVLEEVGQEILNSYETDPHQVSDSFQLPIEHTSEGHAVLEEVGQESLNSYETDTHEVSDSFQMPVQHTSEGHGAESPYFVKFDPYELPDEIRDQTFNSSEVDLFQISSESAEKIPEYNDIDSCLTAEAFGECNDEPLEDYCKEVQCINSEMTSNIRANSLPHDEEGLSLLLMGHDSDGCRDDEPEKKGVLSNTNSSSVQDPKEQSDKQLQKEDVTGLTDLNCLECRSNQSNDMTSMSSSFSEKVDYEMKNESEDGWGEVILGPVDVKRKVLDANNEVPQISTGEIEFDEIPVKDIEVSNHMDNTDGRTRVTQTEEITEPQYMKHLPNCQEEDTMHEAGKSINNMKDAGLNPQDDLNTISICPSDSKMLQMEIFDLWDACNVPLVHRTRFFLLFIKGDQGDAIYMEVELRRLSFIKDAFSWGNSTVLDGQKLTPSSSKRSLHSEREMLAKLIKKRMSKQERINLYVKWHVSLDSKRRSSQLVRCLWTNKTDMDHIMESANIVARLVRFSEPQVPKEAFGLNLTTNQKRKKSYR